MEQTLGDELKNMLKRHSIGDLLRALDDVLCEPINAMNDHRRASAISNAGRWILHAAGEVDALKAGVSRDALVEAEYDRIAMIR